MFPLLAYLCFAANYSLSHNTAVFTSLARLIFLFFFDDPPFQRVSDPFQHFFFVFSTLYISNTSSSILPHNSCHSSIIPSRLMLLHCTISSESSNSSSAHYFLQHLWTKLLPSYSPCLPPSSSFVHAPQVLVHFARPPHVAFCFPSHRYLCFLFALATSSPLTLQNDVKLFTVLLPLVCEGDLTCLLLHATHWSLPLKKSWPSCSQKNLVLTYGQVGLSRSAMLLIVTEIVYAWVSFGPSRWRFCCRAGCRYARLCWTGFGSLSCHRGDVRVAGRSFALGCCTEENFCAPSAARRTSC